MEISKAELYLAGCLSVCGSVSVEQVNDAANMYSDSYANYCKLFDILSALFLA